MFRCYNCKSLGVDYVEETVDCTHNDKGRVSSCVAGFRPYRTGRYYSLFCRDCYYDLGIDLFIETMVNKRDNNDRRRDEKNKRCYG